MNYFFCNCFFLRCSTTVVECLSGKPYSCYKITNKHYFNNFSRIREACLTVESINPKHVERSSPSSRIVDATTDLAEISLLCLSQSLFDSIQKISINLYFKMDKQGSFWLLFCSPMEISIAKARPNVSFFHKNVYIFSDYSFNY